MPPRPVPTRLARGQVRIARFRRIVEPCPGAIPQPPKVADPQDGLDGAVRWHEEELLEADRAGVPRGRLAAFSSLFIELNDLKRITSAGRSGSVATRLFRDAWRALVDGGAPDAVAIQTTGRALAAARLADIDRNLLAEAGLPDAVIAAILHAAIDAVGHPLPELMRQALKEGTDHLVASVGTSPLPAFVAALETQPRAGMTCPGKPRILLEPPENHADHCLMVAVYATLLSPVFRAEPGSVFLAALAHHLHNAAMPDAGFTGEMLLGAHLGAVIAHFTEAGLKELAPPLRAAVDTARAVLPDAATPEGRAFHAADAIDRVLQINQYGRAGALTAGQMLDDMELVHAGPVKTFQDEILREAGLL